MSDEPVRLGETLVAQGFAKKEDVVRALYCQRKLTEKGLERRLGDILTALDVVDRERVNAAEKVLATMRMDKAKLKAELLTVIEQADRDRIEDSTLFEELGLLSDRIDRARLAGDWNRGLEGEWSEKDEAEFRRNVLVSEFGIDRAQEALALSEQYQIGLTALKATLRYQIDLEKLGIHEPLERIAADQGLIDASPAAPREPKDLSVPRAPWGPIGWAVRVGVPSFAILVLVVLWLEVVHPALARREAGEPLEGTTGGNDLARAGQGRPWAHRFDHLTLPSDPKEFDEAMLKTGLVRHEGSWVRSEDRDRLVEEARLNEADARGLVLFEGRLVSRTEAEREIARRDANARGLFPTAGGGWRTPEQEHALTGEDVSFPEGPEESGGSVRRYSDPGEALPLEAVVVEDEASERILFRAQRSLPDGMVALVFLIPEGAARAHRARPDGAVATRIQVCRAGRIQGEFASLGRPLFPGRYRLRIEIDPDQQPAELRDQLVAAEVIFREIEIEVRPDRAAEALEEARSEVESAISLSTRLGTLGPSSEDDEARAAVRASLLAQMAQAAGLPRAIRESCGAPYAEAARIVASARPGVSELEAALAKAEASIACEAARRSPDFSEEVALADLVLDRIESLADAPATPRGWEGRATAIWVVAAEFAALRRSLDQAADWKAFSAPWLGEVLALAARFHDIPWLGERRDLADGLEALVELWRTRSMESEPGADLGPVARRLDLYLDARAGAAATQAAADDLWSQARAWWTEASAAGSEALPEDLDDRLLAGIHLAGRLGAVSPPPERLGELRLGIALILQWIESAEGERGALANRIDRVLNPEGADHE